MSTRVYKRRFDWEEARSRHAQGEPTGQIAASLGVSYNAVYRVLTPARIEWEDRYKKEWGSRGQCDDCGGPMNNHSRSRGSTRCRKCASLMLGTTARETELQCVRCHEWKPDGAFPSNRTEKYARRGRHTVCRECSTIMRQEYRQRHKVPCVGCGAPALPPNEKTTNGTLVARCRQCYYAWCRTPEGRKQAREKALAALS